MDLQTKQRMQRNKIALISAIIISTCILIVSALGLLGELRPAGIFRAFISISVIFFNIIAYGKMSTERNYMHCCCSSMFLLYIVTLCTSNSMEMYAIIYPIAVLVMIFTDYTLTRIGCGIALLGTLIYCITLVMAEKTRVNELVTAMLFAVATCLLSVFITKLTLTQNKENLEEVKSSADSQLNTSSEIVKLANELNQKFVSAKEVAANLNESMTTSHDSMYEIVESTRVNAEAIDMQTSQTSDIQKNIEVVGEEADNMGLVSDRTSQTVEQGVELIEKLKNHATEVANINNETKSITEQLNTSIQDVQAITETILGISSQTNLLALNASIEAARAGEAGKGFAVVADEIRTLAEDTRIATEKISEIIGRLTKDAESAANSMTLSAEYAEKQNELIEETGHKLMEIKNDTDELNRGVMEVNSSVKDVIAANTRIMESITNLSATGQEVAASSNMALSISDSAMEALNSMNSLLGDISNISSTMENIARQ